MMWCIGALIKILIMQDSGFPPERIHNTCESPVEMVYNICECPDNLFVAIFLEIILMKYLALSPIAGVM